MDKKKKYKSRRQSPGGGKDNKTHQLGEFEEIEKNWYSKQSNKGFKDFMTSIKGRAAALGITASEYADKFGKIETQIEKELPMRMFEYYKVRGERGNKMYPQWSEEGFAREKGLGGRYPYKLPDYVKGQVREDRMSKEDETGKKTYFSSDPDPWGTYQSKPPAFNLGGQTQQDISKIYPEEDFSVPQELYKYGGYLPKYQWGTDEITEGKSFYDLPKASQDSVYHQRDKTLQYEELRGGASGNPLPYYGTPAAKEKYNKDVLPRLTPYRSAMEKGEAGDFIYNTGKNPQRYALQEYYRKHEKNQLDNQGKWAGRNGLSDAEYDKLYKEKIAKLPENDRRILMNKGRDWYYKNTAPKNSTWDLKTQGPHPAYQNTWYGRIGNMNTYEDFNPNWWEKESPDFREQYYNHPDRRQHRKVLPKFQWGTKNTDSFGSNTDRFGQSSGLITDTDTGLTPSKGFAADPYIEQPGQIVGGTGLGSSYTDAMPSEGFGSGTQSAIGQPLPGSLTPEGQEGSLMSGTTSAVSGGFNPNAIPGYTKGSTNTFTGGDLGSAGGGAGVAGTVAGVLDPYIGPDYGEGLTAEETAAINEATGGDVSTQQTTEAFVGQLDDAVPMGGYADLGNMIIKEATRDESGRPTSEVAAGIEGIASMPTETGMLASDLFLADEDGGSAQKREQAGLGLAGTFLAPLGPLVGYINSAERYNEQEAVLAKMGEYQGNLNAERMNLPSLDYGRTAKYGGDVSHAEYEAEGGEVITYGLGEETGKSSALPSVYGKGGIVELAKGISKINGPLHKKGSKGMKYGGKIEKGNNEEVQGGVKMRGGGKILSNNLYVPDPSTYLSKDKIKKGKMTFAEVAEILGREMGDIEQV